MEGGNLPGCFQHLLHLHPLSPCQHSALLCPKTSLFFKQHNLKQGLSLTWMLPDASLYDVTDVLEGIGVLFHHVVAESNAVACV